MYIPENEAILNEVIAAYDFPETLMGAVRYGSGHINDTFCLIAVILSPHFSAGTPGASTMAGYLSFIFIPKISPEAMRVLASSLPKNSSQNRDPTLTLSLNASAVAMLSAL